MAVQAVAGRSLRRMIPTIITYAVIALVIYFLVRLIKKGVSELFTGIGDFLNTDTNEQLNVTESEDGTSLTEAEQQAFEPIAKQVADAQELALYETGFFGMDDPDEINLFMPLLEYNGAQLREIYREYGQRRGKTLFEAYASKLSSGLFQSLAYWDESVPGCEMYFDDCDEVEFARGIWQKSGLPISF